MDDEIEDTIDWRTQLQPDSRQRVINKIVEMLMKFLPVSGLEEGLPEVQMMASRFEEKIYTNATSQSDYLRKISMKMLTMEIEYQTTGIPSNSAASAQNSPHPVHYARENEQFTDCNNWRPTQAEPNMDATDWRTQLQPDSRQRIILNIMETLKRHLPISGPEGLVELNKIAARFEEKIFVAAISESDYIRKISMKMLTMETKSQTTGSAASAQNPPDPEPIMDATDWRIQLQPDSRQRVVNKIVETLKRHKNLQTSDSERLNELNRIVVRYEDMVYMVATSQSDYLRRISLKMMQFENSPNTAQNPPDSGLMHVEQWPELTSLLQKLELDD